MGPYLHGEPVAKYLHDQNPNTHEYSTGLALIPVCMANLLPNISMTKIQTLRNIRLESPLFTVCIVKLLPKTSMIQIHGLIHAGDGPAHNPGNSLSREKQALLTTAQPVFKKIRA